MNRGNRLWNESACIKVDIHDKGLPSKTWDATIVVNEESCRYLYEMVLEDPVLSTHLRPKETLLKSAALGQGCVPMEHGTVHQHRNQKLQ
jgi:hypothetical protein